jgi:hypothetical protein
MLLNIMGRYCILFFSSKLVTLFCSHGFLILSSQDFTLGKSKMGLQWNLLSTWSWAGSTKFLCQLFPVLLLCWIILWHLVFSTICSMMATFSEGLLLSEKGGLDPNVLVEVFVNRENLVRLCRVTCHQTPWRLTEFILLFVFYWIILVLSISFEHAQWYNHCSAVLWKINEETRWFSVCFISSSAFVCVRERERERERERFWMMLN